MNGNILCDKCSRECKQPPSAKLVSCARFKQNIRALELFDSDGAISRDVTGKKNKSRKSLKTGD